jgi:hypothetical protein
MSKIRVSVFLCLTVLLSLGAFAQRTQSKLRAPKFSSAYTDLNKECKAAFKSVGEGQDMPLKCKGYGGYDIGIGYSAMSSHLSVQLVGGEAVVSVMPQPLSYYDNKKVEWRMADGKPFAVIIRVNRYKNEGSMDTDTYSEQNKTGESLLVKGLKGYEHIDGAVDARTPGANVKARQLADEQYRK